MENFSSSLYYNRRSVLFKIEFWSSEMSIALQSWYTHLLICCVKVFFTTFCHILEQGSRNGELQCISLCKASPALTEQGKRRRSDTIPRFASLREAKVGCFYTQMASTRPRSLCRAPWCLEYLNGAMEGATRRTLADSAHWRLNTEPHLIVLHSIRGWVILGWWDLGGTECRAWCQSLGSGLAPILLCLPFYRLSFLNKGIVAFHVCLHWVAWLHWQGV